MPSTFVNPVVNPDAKLGLSVFDETSPIELWQSHSEMDAEVVIRAVYKQVLGNAYVMESERLVVPESQLKQGQLSVQGFVREVAKSGLYRSRFLENIPRYRAIELNFKHLLGRAPESYEEMVQHSQLLDKNGFEADIDALIDSEEYQQAFGENVVPFYRGYKTHPGKKMVGFTYLFQILRGPSSSDKSSAQGSKSHLSSALLTNAPRYVARPSSAVPPTDMNQLVAEALRSQTTQLTFPTSQSSFSTQPVPSSDRQQEIDQLKQQLAELQPFASIGASQVNRWQANGAAGAEQSAEQSADPLVALQTQLADARRLAAIGEARLNKWRGRVFNG
jgi:phycoerythrin-associated linker protein